MDAATAPTSGPAQQPIAERRITTVLFGDLVGFTTLSEGRDAEEIRELLSGYFAGARTVVERYGGTIEKFIGDAVMAVWGVPTAHEDDAERAVRAGLELVGMTKALGQDRGLVGLSMRVGVVTGEVAVTLGATGEGMVAGDAVNTASRVQSEAAPGHVWVDDTTRALTAAAIAYDDTGEHELKGKARPVRLFAARAVVGSVRGTERVDGLEAPLTGRDREMRLLKELFHATEESRRPSLVVIEGEPGVGKSRIAWEFEKYIDGLSASVRWHRGRCLAYGDGVAFWALAEAVRGRLGLVENDSGPTVDEHLDAGLERYVPDSDERVWLRPRLAMLIGASSESTFAREELFAAWTTFLDRVGEGHVVVLVVDDAQHADEGLLDFVDQLLGTAGFPVFVLALARTGLIARRPDLAANRRTAVLHLEALDAAQMSTLLDGLVAGLPDATRSTLIQRAEGIPLFAVETVRALIDRDLVVPREGRYVLADPAGVDVSAMAAPASLQALVAARLDALSPVERRVIADCSVLGVSFTRDGIAALGGPQDTLDEALKSLVRKQLLSLETDRFSAERGQYRFVQTVVRQVAYETLSRRDRKAKHLAVAAHIEKESDLAGENAPILAQHYLDAVESSASTDSDRAELLARATALLERAAIRAKSLGAPLEALRYLDTGLQFSEAPSERARLQEAAGNAARDCARYDEAIDRGHKALALYEEQQDVVGAGRTAASIGRALNDGRSDNATAIELMLPYWKRLLDRPGAEDALLSLATNLANAYQVRGELAEAQPYIERCIRLAEASGDLNNLAQALTILGLYYSATGAPVTSRSLFEAAARVAREQRQPMALARALMNSATLILETNVQAAIELDRDALASAKQSGVVMYKRFCSVNLCLALWTGGVWNELATVIAENMGEWSDRLSTTSLRALETWLADALGRDVDTSSPVSDEAASDNENDLAWMAHLELMRLRKLGDVAGAAAAGKKSVEHALSWSGLADDFMHLWPHAVIAAIDAGELDEAHRQLQLVATAPKGLITPALGAQLLRLRGLLGIAGGEAANSVESSLLAAVDALNAYGAIPLRAQTQEALGRWLLGRGRTTEAEVQLTSALETYASLGASAWQSEIEGLISTKVA